MKSATFSAWRYAKQRCGAPRDAIYASLLRIYGNDRCWSTRKVLAFSEASGISR